MIKDLSFKKSDRLTSQRMIGELFSSGRSFFRSPFRVYWSPVSQEHKGQIQIAISVPKKKFKRAVDRNRIRRKIKEAYRKNKTIFRDFSAKKKDLSILLVYSSDEELSYSLIEEKLIKTLQHLLFVHEKSS